MKLSKFSSVLILAVIISTLSFGLVKAIDVPNLECTSFLDLKNDNSFLGVSSSIFTYKMLKLKVGGSTSEDNKFALVGISITLSDIGQIEYVWQNIMKTDIGAWIGYDCVDSEARYGLSLTLIQLEFAK